MVPSVVSPPSVYATKLLLNPRRQHSSIRFNYGTFSTAKFASTVTEPSLGFPYPNSLLGCRFQHSLLLRTSTYPTSCTATNQNSVDGLVEESSVSVILLAGGQGKRMGANMPKQYLPLMGLPIALHSFYTFAEMIEVKEIVVVCDPSFSQLFEDSEDVDVTLKFALPGKERQDSVYNGLQQTDPESKLVCIHDSARPLISATDIRKVLVSGLQNGASVLGVPVKATIKEGNSDSFVVRTLDRSKLWEMQTPQVIQPSLLKRGYELVNKEGFAVTDDVSIVEYLNHPVYITEGSYTNIKITTPDDLLVAERILSMESTS